MYAKEDNLKTAEALMDAIDDLLVQFVREHPGAVVAGDFVIVQRAGEVNDVSRCCGDWLEGQEPRRAWALGAGRLAPMEPPKEPLNRAERRARGRPH